MKAQDLKKRSKSYEKKRALLTKPVFSVTEAMALLPQLSTTKFVGSAELHIRINADTTQADQLVRTIVALPHGSGKKVRIAAFVPDELIDEAKKAGAEIAGKEDIMKNIIEGIIDFDIAVAHPSVMKDLGKVAKILGQKGMMPNPKAGTVSLEIAKTITELKQGRIECKMDKNGIIHVVFGKVSFGSQKLEENYTAVLNAINEAKPNGIKGEYIKTIYVTPSMGPSIKVSL